jgi:serine/threonine-protein kinase
MTSTTSVMGSPYYMSPEQMRSTRNVDARTDIWALGVILYEIVSGHVPFDAETMPQLCGMVLQESPPPLDRFRPNTPTRFEAVILRCLEKDPSRRYQNVGELAAALAEFAPKEAYRSVERASRLSGAPAIDPSSGFLKVVPPTTGDQFTQSDFGRVSERRASPRRWPAVLAGLVVVIGALGWWLSQKADLRSSNAAQPSASVEPARSAPVVEPKVVAAAPVKEPSAPATEPSVEAVASAAPSSTAPAKARPASSPRVSKSSPRTAAEPTTPATRSAPVAPSPRPAANPLDGRL